MPIFSSSKLSKIPVPKETVRKGAEEYALLQAVVNYVNNMRDTGLYLPKELPHKALPAYNADYYYAQVCNGGHAQFLHNSSMDPITIKYALEGLNGAGLSDLEGCLINLEKLGEAADMKKLDDKFFASYSDYHKKMNAWLTSSTKSLSEKRYQRHMTGLLTRDSKRQQRFIDRQALMMQAQLENPLQIGYSLAATCAGRVPGRILPSKFMSFLGKDMPAWNLQMIGGYEYWGLFLSSFALLSQEPPTNVATEEQAQELMRDAIIISEDEIQTATKDAQTTQVGILAGLLLSDTVSKEKPWFIHRMHDSVNNKPKGTTSYLLLFESDSAYILSWNSSGELSIERHGEEGEHKISRQRVANVLQKFQSRQNLEKIS